MMIFRHKVVRTVSVVVVAAAFAAGCTRSGPSGPRAAPPTTKSSVAHALNGAHVHVLGVWSGPEFDSFATVKSEWEKNTGGIVDWEGTQDLPDVLRARVQAGKVPDIAILPNLALMRRLAHEGKLVPLNSALDMNQVDKDYAPAWINLGSDNRKLYGIFYKVADKATIWYNPRAFAAADYRVPKTWPDMTALADKMVADARTPFSIVAASGPGAGWPLTDWISQIVLNKCGPNLYDRWIAAEVPWTNACIKQSFDMFDKIVQAKGYALGGTEGILTTSDANGAYPMYTKPPKAYMYYLASFAQGFIAAAYPNLNPGDDYSFFTFPTINPRYAGAVTVGADVVVMMNNTPAARSFMAYLAGARAQQIWIKLGGFTSVNRSVSPSSYPDPVARKVADDLTNAKIIRFSAGDVIPPSVQRAWWERMLDLVKNPSRLDAILHSLTSLSENAR